MFSKGLLIGKHPFQDGAIPGKELPLLTSSEAPYSPAEHQRPQIVNPVRLSKQLMYRVSIKSLYNLKKLLQSEMMRYRNESRFILISIS